MKLIGLDPLTYGSTSICGPITCNSCVEQFTLWARVKNPVEGLGTN